MQLGSRNYLAIGEKKNQNTKGSEMLAKALVITDLVWLYMETHSICKQLQVFLPILHLMLCLSLAV